MSRTDVERQLMRNLETIEGQLIVIEGQMDRLRADNAQLQQERDSLKVELDKLRDAAQSQPLKSSKLKDALKIKYHRSGGRSCVKHGENVIVGEPPNEQCKVCDITEERDSANTIASDAKFQNERLVERVKAVEQERDSARAELQLEREWHAATKHSVIATIGGVDYEGFPTSTINYLQRLRILVAAEEERDRLAEVNRQLREAASGVMRGFDEGIFVRDTSRDARPGWSIRLLPFITALSKLKSAIERSGEGL